MNSVWWVQVKVPGLWPLAMPPSLNYQMFRNNWRSFPIGSWEGSICEPTLARTLSWAMSKPSSSYSQPENFLFLCQKPLFWGCLGKKKNKREWRQLRVLEVNRLTDYGVSGIIKGSPISYFIEWLYVWKSHNPMSLSFLLYKMKIKIPTW